MRTVAKLRIHKKTTSVESAVTHWKRELNVRLDIQSLAAGW